MRISLPRPLGTLAASVALAGSIGLSGGAALAQDTGSPVASPIGPAQCVAPTTTAPVESTPLAGASPVAEAATGTVVEDPAVIAEATAAVENMAACFNEGNGEAFVALYTEQGRQAAFGPSVDPTALAAEITAKSGMVQISNVTVNQVEETADGALVVDYQMTIGQQLVHFSDTLVNQNGAWLIDGRSVEMPETSLDSATGSIKTSLDGGAIVVEASPNPLMNQPAVKFQITNNGDSGQSVVLLQGGDAASITALDFANLPEGVTFVGEAYVPAGEIVDTAFEGLAEGNYVVVVETDNGEFGTYDLTIDPPFDPNA